MKRLKLILFGFPTVILCFSNAVAQFPDNPQSNTPDWVPVAPVNSIPRREDQVIKKGLLAPSEFDVASCQYLLSQPKTGLIKLLPRESYDWEVYKVEKKLEMRGGGAYFSFHYRAHPYGYGSDISLERGNFVVGFAGADFGMFTDLGIAALDQISVDDPRATYLLNYVPPVNVADAYQEKRKLSVITYVGGVRQNFTVDGFNYHERLPAEVNHTYLLRSIVYDRSDVLVALEVVRKDDDGSVIVAWKLIKEFPAPKLKRDTQATRNSKSNNAPSGSNFYRADRP